ncbi:2-iminobutanoate/2-iminopropanoate deaminase [Usitatibacter rugosus]|uniref:2-iminobutanoate/2-iminopropanoate deaminase n=1 Tax=Usitatibacter rugosus TaxID=2732067 RepID=A0A6M4GP10_9PROT|nr:RidA family protein [Usitatibacter rugosus]QJR09060.1 2-iminobutanoate/2-iminopropanoate deaminase [Usitatibacter rugosus]
MKPISTPDAPAAIGPYSQAVRAGDTVYLSGQVGFDPKTMQLVDGFENQVKQVFDNLEAVCKAAGGNFGHVVRLTIFLVDLGKFSVVNEMMAARFKEPFPARVTIGVASLPRGAQVEIDAILHLVR